MCSSDLDGALSCDVGPCDDPGDANGDDELASIDGDVSCGPNHDELAILRRPCDARLGDAPGDANGDGELPSIDGDVSCGLNHDELATSRRGAVLVLRGGGDSDAKALLCFPLPAPPPWSPRAWGRLELAGTPLRTLSR